MKKKQRESTTKRRERERETWFFRRLLLFFFLLTDLTFSPLSLSPSLFSLSLSVRAPSLSCKIDFSGSFCVSKWTWACFLNGAKKEAPEQKKRSSRGHDLLEEKKLGCCRFVYCFAPTKEGGGGADASVFLISAAARKREFFVCCLLFLSLSLSLSRTSLSNFSLKSPSPSNLANQLYWD